MKAHLSVLILVFAGALLLSSCGKSKSVQSFSSPEIQGDAFVLTSESKDASYGYSDKNPIAVGGVDKMEGPTNERRFLNGLAGPNGESIEYTRKGNCCEFNTPNGFSGRGLLDIYEITWEGLEEPIVLYINMYDYGELKVPKGFTSKL